MRRLIPLFLIILLAAGCRTPEPVAYLTDAERNEAKEIINTYTTSIHPGDQLYISVLSQTPEAVMPFNQETNKSVSIGNENINPESDYNYLVNEQGSITFPILGIIPVDGITTDSLNNYLQQRLRNEGYVSDAIVNSRIQNFRVTVIGEVASPDMFHVFGERLTILEALAKAGDLTIYGQRKNVKVIRTINGDQQIGEIDLTSRDFLESPYYYLQPNDIVYVEQNNIRKKEATYDPLVLDYTNIVANAVRVLTLGVANIIRSF